ncbi:MAG: cryptochrome/photolyase family protein [Phycisphaerales bacterium]
MPVRVSNSTDSPDGPQLAIVFGDQLDAGSPALAALKPERDTILMMEVREESEHVPSHRQRTVFFLSAMRHFAEELRASGFRVRYVTLDDPHNTGRFRTEIDRAVRALCPTKLLAVRPGEWRVLEMLRRAAAEHKLAFELFEDPHFLTTPTQFADWAAERKSLVMEFFYREQRRKTGYLMSGSGPGATPEGGDWNFDADNRKSFGKQGPKTAIPRVPRFEPDRVTRAVMDAVNKCLPDLPGRLEAFGWPVTRRDARAALDAFVRDRLAWFGPYEDAMWATEPTLYHSVLSPLLNVKLLDPRVCCEQAIRVWRQGGAPLQSVEAFIRQLIGWREFIRGVYWLEGPDYAERNSIGNTGNLPHFYWTGETDMQCMNRCLNQVIDTSFGHHIQRLMITGNFALLSGVHPRAISNWYLGMYADGIDWVTLPNTLGMVMHADARPNASAGSTGLVGTKPYAASGSYIARMSNYCVNCRYKPTERIGERACPFTVFYWDFLIRQRDHLAPNQRMTMMLANVDRLPAETKTQIRLAADVLRRKMGVIGETGRQAWAGGPAGPE